MHRYNFPIFSSREIGLCDLSIALSAITSVHHLCDGGAVPLRVRPIIAMVRKPAGEI